MTPLTVNPSVVILIDGDGNVRATASNVSSDLNVIVTGYRRTFDDESANKPFNSLRPVAGSEQVMSMAASKARYATK